MDYYHAQQRVKELKRFYKSLIWFGIIAIIIFSDDFFEKGIFSISHWDGSILLLIWGIILTVKAVKLFIFDADWERSIVEKEMGKHKDPVEF